MEGVHKISDIVRGGLAIITFIVIIVFSISAILEAFANVSEDLIIAGKLVIGFILLGGGLATILIWGHFAPQAPVEEGKEYVVNISENVWEDGIAMVQGFLIFVKNGKPGQKKVKIERVGDSYATATMLL
jgi:predicted RNA-binding protein with TRAM domain